MIGELAQDLVDRIKAIPSQKFGASVPRVGLAVGGKNIDPLVTIADRPCAWVIYVGDENLDEDESCGPFIRFNFIVKVIIDYSNGNDLITTQFPLLEEIVSQLNGVKGPLGAKSWRYEGQTLDELTGERMVFDQRYSITAIV